MIDTHKFAMFLSEFRKSSRQISTTQVEALLLVASGIDNMNDLQIVKNKTEKKYETTSTLGKLLKSLEQKVNSPKQRKRKKEQKTNE